MNDYLGKQAIVRFLEKPGTPYLRNFRLKPIVSIRETTRDIYVDQIVRTVQLINSALPYDKRITVSSERAPRPPLGDSHYIPDGQIYVGIEPQDKWPQEEIPPVLAAGVEYSGAHSGGGPASYIWVNTDIVRTTNQVRKVLAHEILHALGFLEHIEPHEYRSVMNTDYVNFPLVTLPGIDRDVLYALYTRFFHENGVKRYDPNDLGPWTDVSFHLRGDMDDVSFGASSRNGLIQPWAHGPSPERIWRTNQALSGSASWSGRLLGFTSESESLAGASGSDHQPLNAQGPD